MEPTPTGVITKPPVHGAGPSFTPLSKWTVMVLAKLREIDHGGHFLEKVLPCMSLCSDLVPPL
jgi:hypothetical protein